MTDTKRNGESRSFLLSCGGEKEIRTLERVLAVTRFPDLRRVILDQINDIGAKAFSLSGGFGFVLRFFLLLYP